jgi:hypothetical protein
MQLFGTLAKEHAGEAGGVALRDLAIKNRWLGIIMD